ncbi:Vacuolar protein 8 [Tulasnella sp. 403]|nr:Vacuolar protein 8 [Tulasnella sp. 403]
MGNCCAYCFGRPRSHGYEPLLLENEREAVADLLQYLENRTTTNFFTGSPLSALTTLSFSENIDLQRSAALAFAEITEKEVRQVGRDTLDPILFLLSSHDTEVQRAASAALGNLAVNTENKLLIVKLGGLEPLIRQMLSPNVEVQCNAVGCVTNLATHDENKTKIAKSGALVPLTRLARSKDMRVQRNATGALLNMTHSDENRQQLVNAGAIPVLVSLLNSPDTDVQYYCTTALSNIAVDENEEVQCHAISTLRNLAASSEKNKGQIVKAGAVQKIKDLVLTVPVTVQSEMTACVAVLALSDELKPQLLEMGICEVLIPLTNSPSVEVQGNSAAALGNLSSKDGRSPSDDYTPFNDVWDKPDGGLHAYLYRFLSSADATFQHIAVWTIVQLLESGDPQLVKNIRESPSLGPYIRQLADSQPSTPSSVGSRSRSYSESGGEGGASEITALAKRILELTEEGTQAGTPSQGGEDELRRSVREALGPQNERAAG